MAIKYSDLFSGHVLVPAKGMHNYGKIKKILKDHRP